MTYDLGQKAQAIALVQLGKSCPAAANELGLQERSVQRWVAEYREMSAKEGDPLLNTQGHRLAQRAGELIGMALEHIAEEGPATAAKSLIALNAVRGTAVDKIITSKRFDGAHDGTITINFNTVPINQMTDDVIEGELVEPSDATD